MNFRKANNSDLEAIMAIYINRQEWLKQKGVNLWQGADFVDQISDEVADALQGQALYVLENETGILGAVMLQNNSNNDYWEDDNQNYCYLTRLCVDVNSKSMGLGKVILDYSIEDCQKLGYEKLRLDCRADNSHLPVFYGNYGFQEVGRKKFILPNGKPDADSILMEVKIIKKHYSL